MSVTANVISAVIKSVVGDKVGNGLAKEVIGISIDGVSENGIGKISDFINGEKSKIDRILSKESMSSMNIPENTIEHVVAEIKDLFKNIEITDEVLRQCKFDSMKLKDFLWNEYCGYKGDNHIEHESEIKRCLFAVAEVLIKLVRESETFQQDVSIHISNSVDDITIGLQKISEYMEDNFDKLDSSVSLRPFLYTLVRSRSLDFLRKEKTKEKFLAYKKTFPEEEEEYVEYEQLIEKVMRIIENMPQQTATVLKKCFIERKKYQEAGDELGISINTVRWHITKAISILREKMSDIEMVLLYAYFLKNKKYCFLTHIICHALRVMLK